MTQRHFAKVLNSIDVGIAGDRLESSLLLLKVFVPSYSCHFVLFFCSESADVDPEYFCCPVWMVAGVFLFSVTVSCPFPSRFFGQSLSCATGEHCWTMLTSEVM